MRKKLVYIDGSNPYDKHTWSGTPYNIVQQLRRFYDVEVVCLKDSWIDKVYCKAYRAIGRIFGKQNNPTFSMYYAKVKGKQASRLLKDKCCERVFFRGSNLAAYARTDAPVRVYFTDACFHQMIDYYIFNMSRQNIVEGNEVQRRAMQLCNVNVFTSNWAMRDAIDYYHIKEETCHFCHLGASVDTSEFKKQKHDARTVNLLFVGIGWERKGGDIAVECTRLLNEKDPSRKYILHLAGCKPPYEIKDEHIKLYGFLNRNVPDQAQVLISLREQADLFILPTKAECAGIVFCESSAYGIPSITFDTGGIGDYVVNGENGYRLPIWSTAEDFANKILEILSDVGKLEYMQRKGIEMYAEKMSWDSLGKRLNQLIEHCESNHVSGDL